MSSISTKRTLTFTAGEAISEGQAVKFGSNDKTVLKSTGNTAENIGIAQSTAATGEIVEVALPGGGGVALAKETITRGKFLVANADASLEQTNADGDRVIAIAMQSAVVGDIFAVEVVQLVASAANQ